MIYDTIVIGGGAAGLFYAAKDQHGGQNLILEKGKRPGRKLLMSGAGMCNITHGGSIKDFLEHYGDAGKKIRSCLYKNNNLSLMEFLEDGGVPLTEREDGKVFPVSMKAQDILDFLLAKARENHYELKTQAEVTGISTWRESEEQDSLATEIDTSDCSQRITVALADDRKFTAKKLVIATGGASYPTTRSDGSFFQVLERDLQLEIAPLHPALTPIFVQEYPFTTLSGISFPEAIVSLGKRHIHGPVLFTHKGFSGPAILHMSQYVKPGDTIEINFLGDQNQEQFREELKAAQPGNHKGAANYLAQAHHMPKAFLELVLSEPAKKFSSLSQKELKALANLLTASRFSVSGVGGWNEAMVTAGGVALTQIKTKNMSLTNHPQIRVIGEALDINGDTGGYNLQFAYSSACAALL